MCSERIPLTDEEMEGPRNTNRERLADEDECEEMRGPHFVSWIPLTEEEMNGASREYTREEVDTLSLVQHYGADPGDPFRIERACGRREVEEVARRERIETAIRHADTVVRVNQFARRTKAQRQHAGRGNRGRLKWHIAAIVNLLSAAGVKSDTLSQAYKRLIKLIDGNLGTQVGEVLPDVEVEGFRYQCPTRERQSVVFTLRLLANDKVVSVTVAMLDYALKKSKENL